MLPAAFIEKLSHNAFLVHVAHLHEPTDTKVIYMRHRVPRRSELFSATLDDVALLCSRTDTSAAGAAQRAA